METQVLRGPAVCRGRLGCLGKLAKGAVTEQTELAGCQEKEEPRATVGSMGCQDFQERKDTGVKSGRPDPQDLLEKTGRGEKTDRSDREESLERGVLEVCWVPEAPPVHQDSAVFQVWTDSRVPKETWGFRESQVLQDSRACLDPTA